MALNRVVNIPEDVLRYEVIPFLKPKNPYFQFDARTDFWDSQTDDDYDCGWGVPEDASEENGFEGGIGSL